MKKVLNVINDTKKLKITVKPERSRKADNSSVNLLLIQKVSMKSKFERN